MVIKARISGSTDLLGMEWIGFDALCGHFCKRGKLVFVNSVARGEGDLLAQE